MSYLEAPATRMLATQCAACGTPILDAKSIEAGLGPDCRKRHGYEARIREIPEESRKEANAAVYRIALNQGGDIQAELAVLRLLGFAKLVARVCKRVNAVAITEIGNRISVESPYSEEANQDWRRIRGRFFNRDTSCNEVPKEEKAAVWALLRKHYAGRLAIGPKGPFTIG